MKKYQVAVLPGDGIGPEVIQAAVRVLNAAAQLYDIELDYREVMVGGMAIESTGEPLPDITVSSCRLADAVLMGSVGGSAWDHLPRRLRPEYSILALRKALGLYMSLRPCHLHPALRSISPLRREITSRGVDFLLIRELKGVTSIQQNPGDVVEGVKVPEAYDVIYHTEEEVMRIATMAFEMARSRRKLLTSVDKANVLESSRIWRQVFQKLAKRYPDVKLETMYGDLAATHLFLYPDRFDVIVTDNLFGDFLSEGSGAILGSPAMAASASLGAMGSPGVFGGIHGSAESLAGKDVCNPLAAILSGALLMRWGLRETAAADAIDLAVEKTISQGYRTADLIYGMESIHDLKLVSTSEMLQAVLANLVAID